MLVDVVVNLFGVAWKSVAPVGFAVDLCNCALRFVVDLARQLEQVRIDFDCNYRSGLPGHECR